MARTLQGVIGEGRLRTANGILRSSRLSILDLLSEDLQHFGQLLVLFFDNLLGERATQCGDIGALLLVFQFAFCTVFSQFL